MVLLMILAFWGMGFTMNFEMSMNTLGCIRGHMGQAFRGKRRQSGWVRISSKDELFFFNQPCIGRRMRDRLVY